MNTCSVSLLSAVGTPDMGMTIGNDGLVPAPSFAHIFHVEEPNPSPNGGDMLAWLFAQTLPRLPDGLPLELMLDDGRPGVPDMCPPMIGVITKAGVVAVWITLLLFEVEFGLA